MNVWGLHHDHTRHPNPDIFDPLRYQGRTQLAAEYANSPDFENRDHFVYGAGRRICPGIHLAERSLFVSLAKLLWAFDISPKLDERGIPVRVDASAESGYTDGFVICAKPFQAQLQVRSAARKETILAEFANEAQSVFSQFEQA